MGYSGIPGIGGTWRTQSSRAQFPHDTLLTGYTNYRFMHVQTVNPGVQIRDPILAFGNYTFATGGGIEADGTATMIIRAALQPVVWSAQFHRLTFGGFGNYDMTLQPGQVLEFDPAYGFQCFGNFRVHIRVIMPSTGASFTTSSAGSCYSPLAEKWDQDDTTTDNTAASGATYTFANSASGLGGFAPLYVKSRLLPAPVPKGLPAVVLIGDSIGQGSFDQVSPQQADVAFLARACASADVPYAQYGQSAQRAADWLIDGKRRLQAIRNGGFTHAICELSTNDLYQGAALSTVQNSMLNLWQLLSDCGLDITQTETICRCASSAGLTGVSLPTVLSGGSGYASNATFNVTLAGGTLDTTIGTPGTPAILSVSTNSSGVVIGVNSIVSPGYYSAASTVPASPNAATGGTGTGLSIGGLVWGLCVDLPSQVPLAPFLAGGTVDQLNDWMATRPGGLIRRYVRIKSAVESSPGSRKFAPLGSPDGTHPYAAAPGTGQGHVTMAAALAPIVATFTG
jgi:hypothetical protein